MKRHRDESVAFSAVFGLPAEVGMRVAADALSLGLGTAYRRARNGDFPCPLRKVGRRYVVRLTDLMRALGIQDVRVHYDDFEAGARIARGRSDSWHVSDAMTADVVDCPRRLVEAPGEAGRIGSRLRDAVAAGRPEVRALRRAR